MTSDGELNAMMLDGLLNTVRSCAKDLYGENAIYPCDDVKRMAGDATRIRELEGEVIHWKYETSSANARIRELEAELDSLGDLSEWEKVCAGTHVIAPVEPTDAMLVAAGAFDRRMVIAAYRAMIRAAQPGASD